MLLRVCLVISLLFPSFVLAQSNVDKLVEQLDLFSSGSINNWKYSTDFSGDPTKPS